jgi:hypothetical protein
VDFGCKHVGVQLFTFKRGASSRILLASSCFSSLHRGEYQRPGFRLLLCAPVEILDKPSQHLLWTILTGQNFSQIGHHTSCSQAESLMSSYGPDSQAPALYSAREEARGALIITPYSISSLEDTTCPICHETYSDPPSTGLNLEPEMEQEWAVSVDYAAEWFGYRKCCGHTVGRRCLEKHLNTHGAWKNKCPICRDIWYHEITPERAQVNEHPATQARLHPRTADKPRRSQRIEARLAESQAPSSPPLVGNRGAVSRDRQSHRTRTRTRPPYFMQQLLAALRVEDARYGVKGTKKEVHRRLERLYEELA